MANDLSLPLRRQIAQVTGADLLSGPFRALLIPVARRRADRRLRGLLCRFLPWRPEIIG
jgi:hypothetical protein